MHTLKLKTQSEQWLEDANQASQTKQMGLASLHNKGMVYTNYMRRGITTNTDFILSSPEEVHEGSLPEKP
jgi:hypothetical protein